MTGSHRDVSIPWAARFLCWWRGHDIEQTGHRTWHCTRCDRCAKTPGRAAMTTPERTRSPRP